MTGKRFRISKVFELNNPFPIYDGDCPLTQKEASDLLNDLHEEVQSQSIVIKGYQERNDELFKENEQLKQNCKNYEWYKQYKELLNENKELLQFKYKVYRVINERINLLESDYNKAVKAGMPSNSVYGEIELLEELKKELGE